MLIPSPLLLSKTRIPYRTYSVLSYFYVYTSTPFLISSGLEPLVVYVRYRSHFPQVFVPSSNPTVLSCPDLTVPGLTKRLLKYKRCIWNLCKNISPLFITIPFPSRVLPSLTPSLRKPLSHPPYSSLNVLPPSPKRTSGTVPFLYLLYLYSVVFTTII